MNDLNMGELYCCEYNLPTYSFKDPKKDKRANNIDYIPPNTLFVPLKTVEVNVDSMKLLRIMVLTTEGTMHWISVDKNYVYKLKPMTSCDKEL